MNTASPVSVMPKSVQEKPPVSAVFPNRDEILLGVLTAVERDAQISQRTISRELDVALGLANAYLKRCVGKGWIKIRQVPRRRFAYYLTPQGFAEKTRLAGQYFAASFRFFRHAREQMSDLMAECTTNGWRRIAFAGVSELADVGILGARDHHVEIVAIIDPEHNGASYCGVPVKHRLTDCSSVDVVILTSLAAPQRTFQSMIADFDRDRVLAPRLLRLALARTPEAKRKNGAAR
jgi:hypothetical protein